MWIVYTWRLFCWIFVHVFPSRHSKIQKKKKMATTRRISIWNPRKSLIFFGGSRKVRQNSVNATTCDMPLKFHATSNEKIEQNRLWCRGRCARCVAPTLSHKIKYIGLICLRWNKYLCFLNFSTGRWKMWDKQRRSCLVGLVWMNERMSSSHMEFISMFEYLWRRAR